MAKYYITSAIPYVNAKPHIGHALEFVQTDVVARYRRLISDDVVKLCGGDENALKNVQAAEQAGVSIQEFVDGNNALFVKLADMLNAHYDIWQKGSDQKHHYPASQKLWELCQKNGDIYKKSYTGLYCVGCELFYEKQELNENGECSEHPGKGLEEVQEENYFFRLSSYQDKMLELIEKNQLVIYPEKRKHEILSFIKQGLEDISISRTNLRAKNWGVPVPGNDSQRMYVWFDALNIYQSGVGFGWDEKKYHELWPAQMHVIGKGIIRFHAIYWPAFLLSAKLPLPKTLLVHEYFTVNGQKMSKTLGNVIDPLAVIRDYGVDSLRFYMLRYFSPFADGDFSEAKLKLAYNADLANGLGNLIARVAKLCETAAYEQTQTVRSFQEVIGAHDAYVASLDAYKFNDALSYVWEKITHLDRYINDEKPWELVKTDMEKLKTVLTHCVGEIQTIAVLLQPFLPETAEKIALQFNSKTIQTAQSLFPRKI
jgi:methionyl-tRNA synthetase